MEDFGLLLNSPVLSLLSSAKTFDVVFGSEVLVMRNATTPASLLKLTVCSVSWCAYTSLSACELLTSSWIKFSWHFSQNCSHPCCLCKFATPFSSRWLSIIMFQYSTVQTANLLAITIWGLSSLCRVSMIAIWTTFNPADFSNCGCMY